MGEVEARRHKKKWKDTEWNGTWDNWEAIPSSFQLALVWAFLRCGPSTAKDLVFLRGACRYQQLSHLEILMQEEPRWMMESLLRCWPLLAERRVVEGVAYFLSQRTPASQEHQIDQREIKPQEPWRIAFHDITYGLEQGSEDAKRYLTEALPQFSDFIAWTYEILVWWMIVEIQFSVQYQQSGNSIYLEGIDPLPMSFQGRVFPMDMGEWCVEKKLRHPMQSGSSSPLRWSYQGYRFPIGSTYSPYRLPLEDLADHCYGGAGAQVLIEAPYAFIGALREKSNHREGPNAVPPAGGERKPKPRPGLVDLRALANQALLHMRGRILGHQESPILAAMTENQLHEIAKKIHGQRWNARLHTLTMLPLRSRGRNTRMRLSARRRVSLNHLHLHPIQRGWLWLYVHLRRPDPGLNWMAWVSNWQSLVPKIV